MPLHHINALFLYSQKNLQKCQVFMAQVSSLQCLKCPLSKFTTPFSYFHICQLEVSLITSLFPGALDFYTLDKVTWELKCWR